ncbi:MAG: SLATT domain-containing protein [Betaproteobacteria bacterium]
MFALTVVDHLRLDSDQAAQNYTVHAQAAERFARLALIARITVAVLLAAATAVAIAGLWFQTRPYQIAVLVTTAMGFLAFTLQTIVGIEARVHVHRAFAHELWIVAERYRSLLTEIDEGSVERAAVLQRRDELMQQLHTVYERGFGFDQSGHEAARLRAIAPEQAA